MRDDCDLCTRGVPLGNDRLHVLVEPRRVVSYRPGISESCATITIHEHTLYWPCGPYQPVEQPHLDGAVEQSRRDLATASDVWSPKKENV